MIFEVGKEFPIRIPLSQRGGFMIQTVENSFDVLGFIDKPTSNEKREFKQGLLKIGCFVADDVPFIVGSFGKNEFDSPFNFHKVKFDERDKWLKAEANVVNLYLIDSVSNILQAMRMVGIDFMQIFKDTARQQLITYQNYNQVDLQIDKIYSKYTTLEMLNKTKLQYFTR